MADETMLFGALRKAHEEGDETSATRIAGMIKAQRGAAAPPPSEAKDLENTGDASKARGKAAIEFLNRAHLGPVGLGDIVTGVGTAANAMALGLPETAAGLAGNHTLQGMREAAPAAAVVGDVGGTIAGGAGAAKVLTNVAPRLAVRGGEGMARTAGKLAATGAAVGTLQAETTGQDIPTGAAVGGIAGAVLGPAGQLVGSKVVQAGNRGIAVLARALGEAPQDIQNAMDSFSARWGRKATMLDVANMRAKGELKTYASKNAETAASLGEVQAARDTQLPKGVSGNAQQPMDSVTLRAARDERMNTTMGDTNDPRALRNQPVTTGIGAPAFLDNPAVIRALRGDPELRQLVQEAVEEPTHAPLTVDHMENLRQQLRSAQNSEQNSIRSGRIKDVADAVENYTSTRRPAYRQALDQYRSDSNYADAFDHGYSGGSRTTVASAKLKSALSTREGGTGYAHGAAERTAADNLSGIVPGYVRPEPGMSTMQAAHLAQAAMKAGSPSSAYHLSIALPEIGAKVSPEGQRQIVRLLTDARSSARGIQLLERFGVARQRAREIAQQFAAGGGGAGAERFVSAEYPQ